MELPVIHLLVQTFRHGPPCQTNCDIGRLYATVSDDVKKSLREERLGHNEQGPKIETTIEAE